MNNLIRVAVVTKNGENFKKGEIVFTPEGNKTAWYEDINKIPDPKHYGKTYLEQKECIQTVIDLDDCKEDPTLGAFILMVKQFRHNNQIGHGNLTFKGLDWLLQDVWDDNLELLANLFDTGSFPDSDIEWNGVKISRQSAENMLDDLIEKLGK